MDVHLYFSLLPEALIASNLPPEKFGQYYSTGSSYKSKGQSMFFEVDPNFRSDYFDIDSAVSRCTPKADGTPKHSVYISVYRVLEHLPISALGKRPTSAKMAASLTRRRLPKRPRRSRTARRTPTHGSTASSSTATSTWTPSGHA